jgi:hypothetical protein
MSTVELTTKWIERASDWVNPILVKETRQALKSRQFVTTFLLLLTVSWIVSVFGLIIAGDAIEFGSAGREFFSVFYVVLAIAVLILVPFSAYRSLLSERDENTFELLSITALTPRQIVWGKLLSALVQVFIFYSAIAPFIAFTSLLQGFDLAQVTYLLTVSLLASMFFSVTALMLSTFARQRHWRALNSLVMLGGVVAGFLMVLGSAFGVLIAFDDPEFWWASGFLLLAGVAYFVLFQQITTAQLTFESDNRSTGIRITCAAHFWLLWTCYLLYLFLQGSSSPLTAGRSLHNLDPFPILIISMVHWLVVGLFVTPEGDFLSRRIRRGLPRNALLRLVMAPLMPGGARGYLFLLLHVAALWFLVVGFLVFSGSSSLKLTPLEIVSRLFTRELFNHWTAALQFTTGCCCYIVIYIGIGTALGRWGRAISSEIKPAHIRVLTFLVFAAGLIAPVLPRLIGSRTWNTRFSILDVTNPVVTLDQLERYSRSNDTIVIVLAVGALLAVLMNLRAMQRGVKEIVFAKRPDRAR